MLETIARKKSRNLIKARRTHSLPPIVLVLELELVLDPNGVSSQIIDAFTPWECS